MRKVRGGRRLQRHKARMLLLENVHTSLASLWSEVFGNNHSTVMVLNALEVDPGRVWKAPWRWYHESMLDCCRPLEEVQKHGITLQEFACLAECNRLLVHTTYADATKSEELVKFRDAVKNSVQSDCTVLVVSYCRKVLGQTGGGHFSPVGGYESESDKVLILDVARFKYPPYWVSLALLWKAMTEVDPDTKLSRGYCIMKLVTGTRPLLMFRLGLVYGKSKPEIAHSLKSWENWLKLEPFGENSRNILKETVNKFIEIFAPVKICCEREKGPNELCEQAWCKCCSAVENSFENTHIYKIVEEEIAEDKMRPKNLMNLCAGILSWPYELADSERSKQITQGIRKDIDGLDKDAKNEINQLKVQIIALRPEMCI